MNHGAHSEYESSVLRSVPQDVRAALDRGDLAAAVGAMPELSSEQRFPIFWAIQKLDAPRAMRWLLVLLRNPIADIRRSAAVSIGNVRGKQAVRAAIRALSTDEDAGVRAAAANVLSFSNDAEAYEPLVAALRNAAEDTEVRAQAAEGLGYHCRGMDRRSRRYRDAQTALIAALRASEPEMRFWSAFALGQMRSRQAVPELQRVAETDTAKCPDWWLVRDEASDAIADITGLGWPHPQRERTPGP